MRYTLADLKPRGFFKWFEEITRIPHGSGHEEKMADFLQDFAEKRGLACVRDKWNNILIRVPATAGYENEPSVLLQGHMDMVWAKDETATIDLQTDALELCIDGNKLTAKGTTLGADDGAAIATMLALADDETIAHPELELFCTVDEETGLIGMRNADLRIIKSRRLINLDAGNSHEICVSAVGAKMARFEKNFDLSDSADSCQLSVKVFGGLGGHAGIMSHKNRACCINIMGELLFLLGKQMPVYLAEITADGPSIHGDCQALVSVPASACGQAQRVLRAAFDEIAVRYKTSDPNLQLEITECQSAKRVLSETDTKNVVRAMFLLHTGVRKSDEDDLNIIITSVTFSKVSLKDGVFQAAFSIRSLDDSVRQLWFCRLQELLAMLGFTVVVQHAFTAWPGSGAGVMQSRFAEAHKRLFGEDIKILHLHASIEANIIIGNFPDMDAVAIQPTAVDFHTPKETLFIDQVQPFWDLLLDVLATKD